ncbi:hypothetical protein MIND_01321100 [Mycena indigotica]|uniref:TNT domain-containing protein n=1 Tax=Mycena indigotica TaxID=2126181 RepID=A0A8H6S2E8_9AGAR|nr:uncharacterized protein MIND_01321100 [Mycena indigotica]KAF7290801.1 hypothetical protein MIND_01321100 [Mycena indigotica]
MQATILTLLLGSSLLSLTVAAPDSKTAAAAALSVSRSASGGFCTCAGTSYNASLVLTYDCGDYRLGPTNLFPSLLQAATATQPDRVVPKLLRGALDYDRLGGLCPGEWLAKYTNATTGFFIYPDEDGFQLQAQVPPAPVQMNPQTGLPIEPAAQSQLEVPISGIQELERGMLLDRFGKETGQYLAPYGTPFSQRALPPASLNPPQGANATTRYDYHIYRVLKPFDVRSGPIAAWFDQPGQGTQYFVQNATVAGLLRDGFLEKAFVAGQ